LLQAVIHQLRGEPTLCLGRASAALALATEQGLRFLAGIAMALVGWALVKTGAAEKGLDRLRAGIDSLRALNARAWRSLLLPLLLEACLDLGRIEEGLSAVSEGLAEAEEIAAGCCKPALNQLQGQLLLASKEPDETGAEASFRRAIAIAGVQGAKSFELRAASSLARLLASQGKREEARALIAPAYRSESGGGKIPHGSGRVVRRQRRREIGAPS
jgi:tetratricopeptide (TPR) repeat protein